MKKTRTAFEIPFRESIKRFKEESKILTSHIKHLDKMIKEDEDLKKHLKVLHSECVDAITRKPVSGAINDVSKRLHKTESVRATLFLQRRSVGASIVALRRYLSTQGD